MAIFIDELTQAAQDYGITLTAAQLAQFNTYYELLVEWNKVMNLTAITEPHEVAVKHIIDSLTAYDEKFFKPGITLIDVGTGAGFPGLPLKIFCPEIKLTLMDSLNKRVKFLQTVVDTLGLTDVNCVHARAEEAARNKVYREQFDLAVSRAVARLPILCEYCLPFVKRGGYFMALKGRDYVEEQLEAQKAVNILGGNKIVARRVKLPGLADVRAIMVINKTISTPRAYPRKAGTPTKNPL